MKIKHLMGAVVLAFPLLSNVAFAEDVANGLYGGLFATGSKLPSFDVNTYHPQSHTYTGDLARPFGEISYDTGSLSTGVGGGGGGSIGYRYNCFRFEGELLYNVNSANKMFYPGPALLFDNSQNIENQSNRTYLNGQVNEFMGFANLFYDLLPSVTSEYNLYPYIGVGLGFQSTRMTTKYKAQAWSTTFNNQVVHYGPITPCVPGSTNCTVATNQIVVNGPPNPAATSTCPDGSNCIVGYNPTLISTGTRKSTSGLAGQGIIGIAYEMDSYFNIFLDGRYITSQVRPEFDNSRFKLYTINLGINFSFANLGL